MTSPTLKEMAEEYALARANVNLGQTIKSDTSAYLAGANAALELAIKLQPFTLEDSMTFEKKLRALIPE